MNTFQTLGIKKVQRPFEGKKANVNELVGKRIRLLDIDIRDSKKRENSKYARLQVEMDGAKFYVTTGGKYLMPILEQVTKEDLPIETEILFGHGYYFKGTLEE